MAATKNVPYHDIVELRLQGDSLSQISKKLGITAQGIGQRLKNLETHKISLEEAKALSEEELLNKLYTTHKPFENKYVIPKWPNVYRWYMAGTPLARLYTMYKISTERSKLKPMCKTQFYISFNKYLKDNKYLKGNKYVKEGEDKMAKGPGISTTVDNFWNKRRLAKKLSFKVLSEELGIPKTTATKLNLYFNGVVLPPTSVAYKICDYFGVDYMTGTQAFNDAHKEYILKNPGQRDKSVHSRKFDSSNVHEFPPVELGTRIDELRTREASKIEDLKLNEQVKFEDEERKPMHIEHTTVEHSVARPAYLKDLYQKLPYEDFMAIVDGHMDLEDILRITYGNVPVETYAKIISEVPFDVLDKLKEDKVEF